MAVDVRKQCLEELQAFLTDPQDYTDVATGQPLLQSAGFDSVTMVEFVLRLENRFGIEIDADNLEEVFGTLDSLSDYIQGKLALAST